MSANWQQPSRPSHPAWPVLLWLGIIIAAAGLGAVVAVAAALNGIGLVS